MPSTKSLPARQPLLSPPSSSSAIMINPNTRPPTGLLSQTAAEVFRAPTRSKSTSNLFAQARASSCQRIQELEEALGQPDAWCQDAKAKRPHAPSKSAGALPSASLETASVIGSKRGNALQRRQRVWEQPASFRRQVARNFAQQEATNLRSPASLVGGRSQAQGLSSGASHGSTSNMDFTHRSWRPSTVARRENTHMKMLATRIIDQANGNFSGSGAGVSEQIAGSGSDLHTTVGENVDEMAEAFRRTVEDMTTTIDNAYSSIRLQQLQDRFEGKASKEELRAKEEARRRREAKLRLAKKKEQDAKDPKIKVALRLETRRMMLDDPPADNAPKMDIPLKNISVAGAQGPELVPMVDVQMLQARCTGMSQGVSVASLLERRRCTDGILKTMPRNHLKRSGSSPSLLDNASQTGLEDKVVASPLTTTTFREAKAGPAETWEVRSQMAIEKKEAATAVKILRCFGRMRCELSGTSGTNQHMQALKAKVAKAHGDPRMNVTHAGSFPSLPSEEWDSILDAVDRKLDGPLRKPEQITKRTKDLSATQASLGSNSALDPLDKVRQVGWLLVSYFKVRSRHRAVEVIKNFASQLSEWARIRMSMARFIDKLRKVQAKYRESLHNKRMRCERMEAVWTGVENLCLPKYFRIYSKKVLQEKKDNISPKKIFKTKHMAGDEETSEREAFYQQLSDSVQVDWCKYRIPVLFRKALINRYYGLMLRRRARTQSSFRKVAMSNLRMQIETMGFLAEFAGVSRDEAASVVEIEKSPDASAHEGLWWNLSEEQAVDLIAFAAHSLSGTTVLWSEHPCCKDAPGNSLYRRPIANRPDFSLLSAENLDRATKAEGGLGNDSAAVRIMVSRFDLMRFERAFKPNRCKELDRKKPFASSLGLNEFPDGAAKDRDGTEKNGVSEDRNRTKSTGQSDSSQAPKKPLNVDDVLNRLTPRLRAIADRQADENTGEEHSMSFQALPCGASDLKARAVGVLGSG